MFKKLSLFYAEDDMSGNYEPGSLKSGWAIILMVTLLVVTGYLEGQSLL
jgi:hypothetical protein